MSSPLEEVMKQLRPEQLEALTRAAREKAAADAPGLRVKVVLTEGRSLKAGTDDGPPPADDVTARALSRLTPQLKAALISAEPKVLAWLRASHQNRVQFTLDPVGALKKILPGFDSKLISEIAALRSASSRVAVDVPGVKVESFQLEVEPAGKGGKKDEKRDDSKHERKDGRKEKAP
jgi:hypothetical protein